MTFSLLLFKDSEGIYHLYEEIESVGVLSLDSLATRTVSNTSISSL